MFFVVFLLSLTTLTYSYSYERNSFVNADIDTSTLDDLILCRNCGSDISASNYLLFVASPVSRYAFNDTLFMKEKVLVQVLSNDIVNVPVITTSNSNCVATGEWEEESWFPGYRWKFCICPDCGEYIGWLYEPVRYGHLSAKPFFGLILTTVVGESTIESLSKYPTGNI